MTGPQVTAKSDPPESPRTTARVGPSTTPRWCTSMRALTFEKLAYIAPGPPPLSHFNIDDGHATHNS